MMRNYYVVSLCFSFHFSFLLPLMMMRWGSSGGRRCGPGDDRYNGGHALFDISFEWRDMNGDGTALCGDHQPTTAPVRGRATSWATTWARYSGTWARTTTSTRRRRRTTRRHSRGWRRRAATTTTRWHTRWRRRTAFGTAGWWWGRRGRRTTTRY